MKNVTPFATALALMFIHATAAIAAEKPTESAVLVTRANYIRAESDRSFYNFVLGAGGVNKWFYIRKPTPLDGQTVVRMNLDTLYSASVIDTSKGATITIPVMPEGRFFSVLLIDNDHYTPGTLLTSGVHRLPHDTKYLAAIVRIQLFNPNDPVEIALVNKLQDGFIIHANSADPFGKPKYDEASLSKLTAEYKTEYDKFTDTPAGAMGPRGVAGPEAVRRAAAAAAWGLNPLKDAAYINYNPKLPADACYTARYLVPANDAFWSITMYGADGYIKTKTSLLNGQNVKLNADGSFDAYFGSLEACGDVANRLDTPEGWNFLMRVYRPGKAVQDGTYKLPQVQPVTKKST